ncbi:MAG: radical SAM protein [Mariprofundales bacterium]
MVAIPSQKKQPPRLLFFAHGEVATLTTSSDNNTLILQRSSHQTVTLTGSLATAVIQQLDGTSTTESRTRLQLLSRQSPALTGIEDASPTSNGYQQLICDDLGLLFIELTLRCNERCLHCYAGSDPERSETLTCTEVKQVLDEARAMGNPRVQFTGGDPLIHPDLVTLVAHAHALQFETIEIYTNGVLLHQPLLEQLAPFAPHFAFSIYSHCATHHDAITKTDGSHKRTVSAIQRVLAMQLPVRASIIMMNENRDDLDATQQWLIAMGIPTDQIGSDTVRAIGRGSEHTSQNTRNNNNMHPIPPRAGKLCISADGRIYPCIFSRNSALGSIRHGTIREQLSAIPITPQPHHADHWLCCQQRLTCSDCQLSAWLLEKQT